MGVRGLTGLMKEKYKSKWKLEDVSSLVIDGISFMLELYFLHCKLTMGGDYTGFVEVLSSFLSKLCEDEIAVTFVFDGSTPAEKMTTKREREIDKMLVVQRMFAPHLKYSRSVRDSDKGPAPALLHVFARRVLADHHVPFVTADAEADGPIMTLASEQGAHVCSGDSDHMIMEGSKGFVNMTDFVGRSEGQKSFKVLTVESVATALRLPGHMLPNLATLAGNDYVAVEMLASFHDKILRLYDGPREAKRDWTLIEATARWLHRRPDIAPKTESTLSEIPEELWEYSLRSYSHCSTKGQLDAGRMSIGVQCWTNTDPPIGAPAWLVRAFRCSPMFPRQLAGIICNGTHLCPSLMEPLSDKGATMASAWVQSRPIRVAVAQLLGLTHLSDWSCVMTADDRPSGIPQYDLDFAHEIVPLRESKLQKPTDEICTVLQSPAGPSDGELRELFFAALACNARCMEQELIPKSRMLQFAVLNFWVASYQTQWQLPPTWPEIAAFCLFLILPPDKRAKEVQRNKAFAADTLPEPTLAKVLAGFEGCLISTLELYLTLGSPFGGMDFDYLFDPAFLYVMANSKRIDTSKILGSEHSEASVSFDHVIQFLLQCLRDRMKPQLRGEAQRRSDGSWKLKPPKSGGAGASAPNPCQAPAIAVAAVGASDGGGNAEAKAKLNQRKKLQKKLDQINKLLTRGDLNAEEQQKVEKKVELEDELRLLEAEDGDTVQENVLDLWGVQRT